MFLARFGGDFVLFCMGTVGYCSSPTSHGISRVLMTRRLRCLAYTWFLTYRWFYTQNLQKYNLSEWIVLSVSGLFHSTGSLMSIVIASSWVQCAICSAHLYLVRRWRGGIALPGAVEEWQALSVSILFFVILKRGFVLGAVRLHKQNGSISKSVRPTTLFSASLPKIGFSCNACVELPPQGKDKGTVWTLRYHSFIFVFKILFVL